MARPVEAGATGSPWLAAYAGLARAMRPFAGAFLARRLRAGKEDAARLGERLGNAAAPRPAGRLIWLHGASVGELLSLLPLVAAFRARGFSILVTSGTLTSATLAQHRLPEGAIHQFVPLDFPDCTARFIDHWRPDLALFAESELWPNLMRATLARCIPLGIVNGRLSERSFRRWRRFGALRPILQGLSLCCVQSEADAARFRQLGAPNAVVAGNLKFDAEALPVSSHALDAIAAALGSRPLWIAASTHPGEERIVLAAHRQLAERWPDLLTVIVPRHPERAAAVATLADGEGLTLGLRSNVPVPRADQAVFLVDTLGELGLFYRAAPIAFIGGSLSEPGGGHNPIEPALLGPAMIAGPRIGNFSYVYRAFAEADASLAVHDGQGLAGAVAMLLSRPERRAELAANARRVVEAHRGATERTLAAIEPVVAGWRAGSAP